MMKQQQRRITIMKQEAILNSRLKRKNLNGPAKEWNEYLPNEEDLQIQGGADSGIPWEDLMEFNPEIEFRKPKFDSVVGQKFRNFRIFREVLYEWNIREGDVVKPTKNESKMLTAKCTKGCSWRIHAFEVQEGTTFQIKTLSGTHTCGREYNNKHTTSRYLAKKYLDKLRDEPDIGNILFFRDVKKGFNG
ncbi:hypothetical protein ACH5RR_016115 [Cinchona calisaya]|uniref:Transposase MuDR plant domain-containing protein n=1 Tax=Cinchona calisaya TaxID=153742 RepID=A0ABD2ZV35_9GENT